MTKEEMIRELAGWLRDKPDSIKRMALRFPPGRRVRAPGYAIPSSLVGSIGRVVSFCEDEETVGVVDDCPLNVGTRGMVKAKDCELLPAEVGEMTEGDVRLALTMAGDPGR
jgi:hypothetical protein